MRETNCQPTSGAALEIDSMEAYDELPPFVRKALQDANAPFSAVATHNLIRMGGPSWALQQLRHNELMQHNGAVRAGVLPRITGSFQVYPREPTSELERARRERREKAAARIARRYR